MGKKREYLFETIPRWLLYSGLPKQLNEDYGSSAWAIFRCLIELDCRFNNEYPDTFDQSFDEIAQLEGLSRITVSKYIKLFEKDNLLMVKRGKFKGKKSTFKITNPINTPKHPKAIHALNGGLLNRKGKPPILRYAESVKDVNALERVKASKIDNESVKSRQESVKDVYYNKKKEEEKRRKEKSVNEAQEFSSSLSKREENCLLTQTEVIERSHAFAKELKERINKKEKEKQQEKQPKLEERKKALLKQAEIP